MSQSKRLKILLNIVNLLEFLEWFDTILHVHVCMLLKLITESID